MRATVTVKLAWHERMDVIRQKSHRPKGLRLFSHKSG